MARDGIARILTRHVVRPAEEEFRANPPSRSAKLRAVEMFEESYGDPGETCITRLFEQLGCCRESSAPPTRATADTSVASSRLRE